MTARHISSHRIVCWRLTLRCNRTCPFCLSFSGPGKSHPPLDVRRSVSRLVALGVEKISYSGGEPLLYPLLGEIVEAASQAGLIQILTTNGDFPKGRIDLLLPFLEYIKLSFYGNSAQHDSVMGSGHYSKLIELAKLISSKGFVVGANYMISGPSLGGVHSFLREAASSGIRQVLFQTYIPTRVKDIDIIYDFSSRNERESAISYIIDESARVVGRFSGGIKIHDYSEPDFYIVLDEEGYLTMPRPGSNPLRMGGLYDDKLQHPDEGLVPAELALERVWCKREKVPAIIPVESIGRIAI